MEEFVEQFERASGKSAVFELEVRLLADKTPALTKFAHEQSLTPILTPLVQHYSDQLSADEKTLLDTAKTLRNKVVHSDFKAAADKLDQPSGGVMHLTGLPTGGGRELTKFFQGVADGKITGDAVRPQSAKTVGIMGWLLESGANGTFVESERVFRGAIDIIVRLSRDNH
jgi:hypothetical protein